MEQPPVQHIEVAGRPIAVRLRAGSAPALLFLPGYASDMDGAKALVIDALAAELGIAAVRLDYSGTGSSPGEFASGTLERWLEEALAAADQVTGPLIPVGSSMGGWIALHLALRRPERVAGLVGIAAAPDFTDWGFDSAQKERMLRDGLVEEPNPYGPEPFRTHRGFWESGQSLRLLDEDIAIDCPVRLIHGEADPDVPIDIAWRLLSRLRSADVQLLAIKQGGHRLSAPHELAAIRRMVKDLVEAVS